MPINFLSPGMEGCVKRIAGRDDTRRFLESLGLVPGGRVTMVSSMGDNVILTENKIATTELPTDPYMGRRIHMSTK